MRRPARPGSGPSVVADGRGMTRRELLAGLGLGVGATVVLGACTMPSPGAAPPTPPPGVPDPAPFGEGVMAGDPMPGASTIWTRVAPPASGVDVGVLWTVAEDPAFTTIRAGGLAVATAADGHCVTVPVDGLGFDRWYYYRFETSGGDGVPAAVSRTGRLRTAPAPGSSPDHLRFAFASCQQINDSWFVAHQAAAAEPGLDFFMHLGDYVYVSDTGTITLEDYRDTYRRWRAQPLLRDLQAAVPMVAMWDDGEFYNGVDVTGDPARLSAAKQAFFDYFPVVDPGDQRLYRSLSWGDLADVPVIDVRAYRDPSVDTIDYTSANAAYDPSRSTLGAAQYAWLTSALAASSARWRLVGTGYNIGPWKLVNLEFLRAFRPDLPPNAGIYAPNEAWDDYPRERRDLLQFLVDHGVTDTAFVSGHTHTFLTTELRPDTDDPASPTVAFDFCTGSLTADPDVRRAYLGDLPPDVAEGVVRLGEQFVLSQNAPYLRYMNLVEQGYTVVDVTPEEMVVTSRLIDTSRPDAVARDGAKFRLTPGATRLEVLPVPGGSGTFG
jgi:alkaline phosphatase D